MMPRNVDVVVVGAGLAGLTAAWRLYRAGVASLAVLEAQDRVGGRTLNRSAELAGYVEQGGTWVGPTHRHLLALAKEVGVAIRRGKPEGKTFYGNRGQWTQVDVPEGEAPGAAQEDFQRALAAFERLSDTINTEAPWRSANAAELDRTTIGDWIERNTRTAEGRALFEGCIRKMQGGDPHAVSLLWMLQFVGSATFRDLLDTAEDYRFVGGSQSVSLTLAEALGPRVVLNAPVARVEGYMGEGVTVHADQQIWRAQRAVIATMPGCLRRVAFDPPLPREHRKTIADWASMSWLKFNAVYPKPFWRGRTIGSQFLCLDRLVEAFDISPKDESWGELVGFLLPDSPGRKAADRVGFCLEFLRDVYGEGADKPATFLVTDWHDNPWIGGCISALPPGLLTEAKQGLSAGTGRLEWAGSERSDVWVNYMEGAVRSGERAARNVLAALAVQSVPV